MSEFNCVVPTWNDMETYAKNVSNSIKKSNFYPDTIVALSRGGLVPARIIGDLLHIKEIHSMKINHWGLTATKDGKAKITQGLNLDLTNKQVLIVDDITDTGESMKLAIDHVTNLKPAETKTATLIHLKNSDYKPHFFGHEREWSWIIFPWNYQEDLVNLISKIEGSKDKNAEKIKEEFKVNFNVDINVDDIKDTLEHIEFLNNVNKKL